MTTEPNKIHTSPRPIGNAIGFIRYLKHDLLSGFMVFLIALPLCLGIALASGYPAVAGVFTAIVGAVLATVLSNSEMTIKGPAAGLIVIALGAITEFGFTGGRDQAADFQAYRMALAVGAAAGIIQVIFGLVRAGIFGDFFPTSVVHGMLAAIGVIIMLKQLPVAIGQTASGEPLEILQDMPETLVHLNPDIAAIGGVSLLILFGLPLLQSYDKFKILKFFPGPLLVLWVAVPMGMWFDLSHEHTYSFLGQQYQLGEQFLVSVPSNLLSAVATPDFSVLKTGTAWKWVIMFALVGSLESMLSGKAIDLLDPWKRKTNLNRDLVAIGVSNLCVALIGGLPMISEIVRSKANIDNGGRTRFANLWHGMFLLGFVVLLPALIHRIPLAALAAMLFYTGYRLASPKEFVNVYRIGREQFIIFVTTACAVLATDLLIGIGIGIGLKLVIHMLNGVPVSSLFHPYLEVQSRGDQTVMITAQQSAVFSNWIPFKRQIEQLGLVQRNHLIVDLAGTKLVDHSVMEGLHELKLEFEQAGLRLDIVGLDAHQQFSGHPYAARKRGLTRMRKVSIVVASELERLVTDKLFELGASGYTAIPCTGAGRHATTDESNSKPYKVLVEAVVPNSVAETVLNYLNYDFQGQHRVTAYLEIVEVLRHDQFA